MRHRVRYRKLGRSSAHRMALLRNLCTSLLNSDSGQIVTTLPKAKELRPFVEKAVTLGKRGTLHSRRLAAKFVMGGHAQQRRRAHKKVSPRVIPATAGVRALDRLFDSIGPKYADRPGGYTRIVKLGFRKGDGAPLAAIQFVEALATTPQPAEETKSKKKTEKTKAEAKTESKPAKKREASTTSAEVRRPKSKSKKSAKAESEETSKPGKTSRGRKKKSEKSEE